MAGKLSVVLVSFNTRQLLEECLASLFPELNDLAEDGGVVVVDNASADGSADRVRERFPQAVVVKNPTNRGFAAAVNQGIALSRGEYVLLLNPDTTILNGAVAALVSFLDAHPQVGVVAPRLLNPDGSHQHSAFRFPSLWMSFLDFFPLNHKLVSSPLNGRYPPRAYLAPFPADHPLGACFLIRRRVVEEVGPLSEDYFMYCEEIDWCLRIKRAGWLIYCQPQAQVIHYGGQSTRQVWPAMFYELHRSRLLLFRKHYSVPFSLLARCIVALGVSWEMFRGLRDYRRRAITQTELKTREGAYRRVLRLVTRDA
ncbi:MAG: glycosyltransferase family 2 protein [Chloroflexi bacterium]|nr:glycosyltransferase family 2 protein [Chloroflexota bacterium]